MFPSMSAPPCMEAMPEICSLPCQHHLAWRPCQKYVPFHASTTLHRGHARNMLPSMSAPPCTGTIYLAITSLPSHEAPPSIVNIGMKLEESQSNKALDFYSLLSEKECQALRQLYLTHYLGIVSRAGLMAAPAFRPKAKPEYHDRLVT